MMTRIAYGKKAEQFVGEYLQKEGFSLLTFNYRKPFGEIDLIAADRTTVVFVEVKMRAKEYFDLSEVITRSKQRKIIAVAKDFISRNALCYNKICRFDVALLHTEGGMLSLTYIPNAFNEGDSRYDYAA